MIWFHKLFCLYDNNSVTASIKTSSKVSRQVRQKACRNDERFILIFLNEAWQRMKCAVFIVIVFIHTISCQALADEADCGLPNIEVNYEHLCDAKMACEGISRALSFFKSQGYILSGEIKIVFHEKVDIETTVNRSNDELKLQACCYYYGLDGTSNLTSWTIMTDKNKKVFGSIAINRNLYISLIVHEVSHCIYHNICKLSNRKIDRALTEFVSYVAQIETMDKVDKSKIISLYNNDHFDSIIEVNSLNHKINPHKFGAMSFMYFKKNPGIIKSILNGEIDSGDRLLLDYKFLHR